MTKVVQQQASSSAAAAVSVILRLDGLKYTAVKCSGTGSRRYRSSGQQQFALKIAVNILVFYW